MDRCPNDETTAKNFVWNKSSSHSQEKLEKILFGFFSPLAIGGLIYLRGLRCNLMRKTSELMHSDLDGETLEEKNRYVIES